MRNYYLQIYMIKKVNIARLFNSGFTCTSDILTSILISIVTFLDYFLKDLIENYISNYMTILQIYLLFRLFSITIDIKSNTFLNTIACVYA